MIRINVCIAFSVLIHLGYGATVITFDDLSPGAIPDGYGGLEWNDIAPAFSFQVVNGSLQSTNGGYYNGRVSPPNVAANQWGNPAMFRYASRFNLDSAYLTAASSNGLQVRVQGFVGNSSIYDQTNVLNTSAPTFINFNYLQVDTVVFTPSPGSSYGYYVMDNLSITSTNAPIPNFIASPRPGQPLTIGFEDQSVGAITNREWDFGDGSPHFYVQGPYHPGPVHTYSNDGPFSVTLTVMGSNGTTNSETAVINVGPTIEFSPTWGPAPLAVQFNDRSNGGITNWDWNFDDGSAHSSTQNPSHTYTNPGTFDITLIVKNTYGATNSGTRRITVDPPDGSTLITFDDISPGILLNGYRGILWSNFGVVNGLQQNTNEGYYNGIASIPNVAFNAGGNPASFSYGGHFDLNSAYLTAAFGNGLQVRVQGFAGTELLYDTAYTLSMTTPTFIQFNYLSVDEVTFTTIPPGNVFAIDNITAKTTARFGASPTSGQAPLTVQFIDRSIGTITNWDWNFGDGSADSFSQNPSHEYLVGDFNAILTVTDTNGRTYSSDTRISTTAPPPPCSITASPPLGPGMVRGWGCNYVGQINTGCFSNITAIAAGRDHSLLLKNDGTVIALGTIAIVPSAVSNVIAVSAGESHNLVLKSDGTVCGWTGSGPIGVPQDLTNVVAISAGVNYSLALKADGTVFGLGTTVPDGMTDIVAVSAGRNISLALRDDGRVQGWNIGGAHPSSLSNIVAISAGDDCCYEAWEALRDDSTVLVGSPFDDNWYAAAGGVVAISTSRGNDSHTSWALMADSTVISVGPGFRFCGGPAVPPEGIYLAVAVASGDAHNLALIGDGLPVVNASLLNPSWDTNGFRASVPTENGRVYRLEYKNSLADSNWNRLPLVAGTGAWVSLTDSTATGAQRFYRVRRW